MKKQEKQKTQIKKGDIYHFLDSSNNVSYYIVKEVDDKKEEAKILMVYRPRDILDDVVQSFQPLDYEKAFNDELITIKIKHLEKLNLKEVK